MNSRLLSVAMLSGAVFVSSAFAVDPRSRTTTPQQTNRYSQPSYELPGDTNFGYDPFQTPNRRQPASPYNDDRLRFDMVSYPSNGVTPGTPLITNPSPTAQPRLNPDPLKPTKKNRWRIGIYSTNTDTGVLIKRVVPGSPAQVAGLESNDVIVNVSGYQVGRIDGVLHDLGSEFDMRCDQDGATTLLVHNGRDGSLVELPVQLEPRFATVTGEVVWRAKQRLPRESFAHVELRERIRVGAPMVTIAETTVHNLRDIQKSQTGRVPFELEYANDEIDPNRRYMVVATITDGFHTLYTTERPYEVITNRNPRRVDIALTQIHDWNSNTQVPGSTGSAEFDQFVALFEKFMGRPLRPYELEVYRQDFSHGRSYEDALVNVIGTPEFYTKSRSDDREFIIRAHQMRTGRMPTEEQIRYWMSKLEDYNGLTRDFSRDFVTNLN